VMGNQTTVSWCGAGGILELNVSMPLLAACMLESVELLANGSGVFAERCVAGIEADRGRCGELIEWSLSMVTSLVPRIGYENAAGIARESVESGRTVRELCRERLAELGLSEAELEDLLDPARMSGS
jgi:fumarate hydratase, class II